LVVHQCSAAPFNPALAEFTDSNHGELWTRST
jgi:hypothetical protein